MFAYNTFNSPNLGNYSPYELTFGVYPHNYLLMTLYGRILQGIFEHERLKPAIIRTNHGNVQNLAELRQIMNTNLKFS